MFKLQSFAQWFRGVSNDDIKRQLGSPPQDSSKCCLAHPPKRQSQVSEFDPATSISNVEQFVCHDVTDENPNWSEDLCDIIEQLARIATELTLHPKALSPSSRGYISPEEGLELIGACLESEISNLRFVINQPNHSKTSVNLLWTIFTEFGRIRDSVYADLKADSQLSERLVRRHHDLLAARMKIHFDSVGPDLSAEIREIAYDTTQHIHQLLAKTSLPLPGIDGEPQTRLVAFFHAIENLMNGISKWLLAGQEQQEQRIVMYLDLFDSVQRANMVDLSHRDYSSFLIRIQHVQEFLELIGDQVPEPLLEQFEEECMIPAPAILNPSHFEERVEEIINDLDTIEIPNRFESQVQSVMAELLALCLPLEELDGDQRASQVISDLRVQIGDVIERLQHLISNTDESPASSNSGRVSL